MRYFLILLLLISKASNSQVQKGSYFIVASCKDGILLAADSRVSICLDGRKQCIPPDAYFDSLKKIFVIRDFALATAGNSIFNGKSLEYYINQFTKSINEKDSFMVRIYQWYNFAKKIKGGLDKQRVIIAKYENGIPKMAYINGSEVTWLDNPESYITLDTLSNFKQHYRFNISCIKMKRIIQNDIYDYAVKYKKIFSIGGPISFLKIDHHNKMTWLSKINYRYFETMQEEWNAYKKGELKINFLSKNIKKTVDSLLTQTP